jgi:FKBP-type peptidyl-prolyl cis-trans isomerase
MKRAHTGRQMLVLLASTSLLFGACKHASLDPRPLDLERGDTLSPAGVHIRELYLGYGQRAHAGDTLVIDYTAWLLDGTRVDSSLDRGVPIEFELGAAPIAGWNEGLQGVMPQGRRRLEIPARLAYGDEGFADLVPPGADLRFEVHVLEVRRKP